MDSYHIPVLLQSVCHFLNIENEGKYVDATLGGGGHAKAIINLGGRVLGLDQDVQAISNCPDQVGLIKVKSNFIHLEEVVSQNHWLPVSGILFDLGVSSYQIDTPERGFSYTKDGPLDMRMDQSLTYTAADLINVLSPKELEILFSRYGEEPKAKYFSKILIAHRPFTNTSDLSSILPNFSVRQRIFQALRIAVNDELRSIEMALPQALSVLKPQGRLLVISFHSLEDKIVNDLFSEWEGKGQGTILNNSPIVPTVEEISNNSRSKSAKLRVFIKK